MRRADRLAPLFAALGDETRLRIVRRLGEGGARSIVQLTEESRVSRQAISKHLLVLERAGVVRSARRGRERLWTLDPQPLEEARRDLAAISAGWEEALQRLRAFVEKEK